jgi:hypothetical protein
VAEAVVVSVVAGEALGEVVREGVAIVVAIEAVDEASPLTRSKGVSLTAPGTTRLAAAETNF